MHCSNHMDSEEDEPDFLAKKALGIFEDISGYDPKETPTNGYEYLYQVMSEASKIPKTAVAELSPSKYKHSQTYYLKETEDVVVNQEFIPSQEWQRVQVQDFINVRVKITRMKSLWKKKKLHFDEPALPSNPGNEDSWLEFCSNSKPSLHSLFSIQQCGLDDLLNYFSAWLNDGTIDLSPKTTLWLYSIFACLEEPLIPSTCANLRNIIRAAKTKRAALESSNDELLVHLNLIIYIAARYFRQTDLCD